MRQVDDLRAEYDLKGLRQVARTYILERQVSDERLAVQYNEDGSRTIIDLRAWRQQRDLEKRTS
jgi:hypothetical protein